MTIDQKYFYHKQNLGKWAYDKDDKSKTYLLVE